MARGTWGGTGDPHPLKVRISFTLDGVKAQTGFKLRDQSLTASDPQDAAESVGAFVQANMIQLFSVVDRFDGVDVVDMTTGEGGGFSFNNVTGTLANSTAEVLPTYVQASIALKGELRRRYGRGGMLMPVRLEAWQDRGSLNATGVAAINGFLAAMQSEYMTSNPLKTYRLINAHGVIQAKAATPTTPARPQVEPSYYDVQTLRLNTKLSFVRSRRD